MKAIRRSRFWSFTIFGSNYVELEDYSSLVYLVLGESVLDSNTGEICLHGFAVASSRLNFRGLKELFPQVEFKNTRIHYDVRSAVEYCKGGSRYTEIGVLPNWIS